MGRKSLGEKRLSNAERQKCYGPRQNPEKRKLKDRNHKQRESAFMKTQNYTKLTCSKRTIHRNSTERKKEQNNETSQTPLVKLNFSVLSRSVKRAKRSLPKDGNQRKVVVTTFFREDISCSPRKVYLILKWFNTVASASCGGRPPVFIKEVKKKLDDFLCRNTISFTLPRRNNQIYIGKDENSKSKFNSKKFILWAFHELASILSEEEDEGLSKLKFSTIYQYIKLKDFIV